ncbi:MAG: 2Fe-2S iron-sulfur cluster-binding protein [Armatimonadota bacterium]
MPTIKFLPSDVSGEVAEGTTVLDAAEELGVEVPSVCGGMAACGACLIEVQEGAANLAPHTDDEVDCLETIDVDPTPENRLACQARITGDVAVRVPDE